MSPSRGETDSAQKEPRIDTQTSLQSTQPVGGTFPHVSARIERGQRGGYGWTLGATVATAPGQDTADAFVTAILALAAADVMMRRTFAAGDSEQAAA